MEKIRRKLHKENKRLLAIYQCHVSSNFQCATPYDFSAIFNLCSLCFFFFNLCSPSLFLFPHFFTNMPMMRMNIQLVEDFFFVIMLLVWSIHWLYRWLIFAGKPGWILLMESPFLTTLFSIHKARTRSYLRNLNPVPLGPMQCWSISGR